MKSGLKPLTEVTISGHSLPLLRLAPTSQSGFETQPSLKSASAVGGNPGHKSSSCVQAHSSLQPSMHALLGPPMPPPLVVVVEEVAVPPLPPVALPVVLDAVALAVPVVVVVLVSSSPQATTPTRRATDERAIHLFIRIFII